MDSAATTIVMMMTLVLQEPKRGREDQDQFTTRVETQVVSRFPIKSRKKRMLAAIVDELVGLKLNEESLLAKRPHHILVYFHEKEALKYTMMRDSNGSVRDQHLTIHDATFSRLARNSGKSF
jgi:hypothetical protein